MDILLTGIVRSGTTLACHLLNKVAGTVALHEPMNPATLVGLDDRGRLDAIAAFCADQRRSLLSSGTATCMAVGGAVPDNPYGSERDPDGLRRSIVALESVRFDKPLGPDFALVVKHPNAFTALLPLLVTRFPCRAIVRNPLATLLSMHSTQANWTHGRVPMAEAFDGALAAALDRETDVVARQLRIVAFSFGRYAECLPRAAVIRYEDIVATGGAALAAVVPAARALAEPLAARNCNPLYDRSVVEQLADRVLETDAAWQDHYSRADVTALRDALVAR